MQEGGGEERGQKEQEKENGKRQSDVWREEDQKM